MSAQTEQELTLQDKDDGAYAQTRGNTTFESGVQAASKGIGLSIE